MATCFRTGKDEKSPKTLTVVPVGAGEGLELYEL